jgi:hypothetical protein
MSPTKKFILKIILKENQAPATSEPTTSRTKKTKHPQRPNLKNSKSNEKIYFKDNTQRKPVTRNERIDNK